MLPSQLIPDSPPPHDHVLDRIARLARLTRTLHNRYLFHLGLETGQAAVLRLVIDNPGITQDAVRHILKLDKSNVSRVVRVLERCRMLQKTKCPDGGKSPALASTELAEWLVTMFREVDEDLMEEVFGGFQEDESRTFHDLLGRASANVSHVLHSPPDPRPSWLRTPAFRMKGI
jgi:DNA-binding MarR family transcriptional regulator